MFYSVLAISCWWSQVINNKFSMMFCILQSLDQNQKYCGDQAKLINLNLTGQIFIFLQPFLDSWSKNKRVIDYL